MPSLAGEATGPSFRFNSAASDRGVVSLFPGDSRVLSSRIYNSGSGCLAPRSDSTASGRGRNPVKAPSRKAGLICLLLFILGLLGLFVPLSGVPYIGSALALVNQYAVYLLLFGYGLLLLAVYVI